MESETHRHLSKPLLIFFLTIPKKIISIFKSFKKGKLFSQSRLSKDYKLKNHFDEVAGNGFDYAFRYPGMNKVLQAAGRVIRTTEDRGVILLLDDRFLQSDYQGLYPREWQARKICNVNTVQDIVNEFWNA